MLASVTVAPVEDQAEMDLAQAQPFAASEAAALDHLTTVTDWLKARTQTRFRGSVDAVAIAVLGGDGVDSATGLDATVIFERPLMGKWLNNHLSLYGRMRMRTGMWNQAPAELGQSIGTAWGVIDGFSDAGFEIPDFFFRHVVPQHDLEFRYGQMVIDAQLDGQPIGGAKQAFHNRAFSSNPAAAFPRMGAGTTIAWDPDGPWDVVLAVTTVQGSQAGDQVDFAFTSSDLFKALQFAYQFPGNEVGPRRLQLLLWHSDAAPDSNLDEGEGLSLTYSHRFEAPIDSAYCRLAYASGQATDASLLLVGGVTMNRSTTEHIGLAAGIGLGNPNDDWNGVIEGFYRKHFSETGSLAINAQLLVGDRFADGGHLRILLGASAHIGF